VCSAGGELWRRTSDAEVRNASGEGTVQQHVRRLQITVQYRRRAPVRTQDEAAAGTAGKKSQSKEKPKLEQGESVAA
jgi:hypothetical protein